MTLEAVLHHQIEIPGFTIGASDSFSMQCKHLIDACKNLNRPHLLLIDTFEQALRQFSQSPSKPKSKPKRR